MIARVITSFIIGLLKSRGLLVDEIIFAIVFFVLMVVIPVIWKGNTLGSKIVRMRLIPKRGMDRKLEPTLRHCLFTFIVLSLIGDIFESYGRRSSSQPFAIGVVFLTGLLWFFIFCHIVMRWIKRTKFFTLIDTVT